MTAREFTRQSQKGVRRALRVEPDLVRQYELVLRAAARRAKQAYLRSFAVVHAAAGDEITQPPLTDVLNERVLEESALARTRAARRKMLRSIQGAFTTAGDGLDPVLENLVAAQAGVQAARLVAGSREQVADVMRLALEEGWSVPRTADAIHERLTGVASWQATMLARTDLISLSNGASVANAQALGEESPNFKVWVATADSRTREDHLEADGQTVPMDQPFDIGGEALMYPGDPAGSDDQTINCRCTVIYADSELEQREHSDLGGIVEMASADEPRILGGDMPWEIEQVEDEFCVVRSDTGETVTCHADEEKAIAHIRALYANVEDVTAASLENQEGDDMEEETMEPEELTAAAPLPPVAFFEDPKFTEPTPITVTEDGRVSGHIATWDQCHTGIMGVCRTPPRGLTYDFFHTGVIDTDAGPMKVGRISVNRGHAPLTASRAQTMEHYDNTESVGAYVRAGEDEHGPWVSGVLRAGASDEIVEMLKANPPSGDWRTISYQGRRGLELLGITSVPIPGFPVPRAVLTASAEGGDEVAVLIAGMVTEEAEIEEVTEEQLKAELARIRDECLPTDPIEARLATMVAAAR